MNEREEMLEKIQERLESLSEEQLEEIYRKLFLEKKITA